MAEFRARYSSCPDSVPKARRSVAEFARGCGFTGRDLSDIESAVGEALANASEHGGTSSRGFRVKASFTAGELIVEVRNSGFGFATAEIFGLKRPPPNAIRGFGIYIMRQLMDDVRYSDSGRRIRLSKRHRAVSLHDEEQLENRA
ncbi:MAG TPA: ATP-binding protein [Candidatus Baltobacteraceae bacterium]